jgi:NitT/TauT family transport system substrate-binding protein
MQIIPSRRDFLTGLAAAGAVSLPSIRGALAAEAPPETTAIRLSRDPNICLAPLDIAGELLRAEGFTDINYISGAPIDAVALGELDFDYFSAPMVVSRLDAGAPITAVAGVHSGCYELFAHAPIQTISDLKGKRVGLRRLTTTGHLLLSVMAAHVGLDPHEDITWVTSPELNPMELFARGEVDAFIGFPPEPQELRARKIGRVILNTTTDPPWSQYICCLLIGNTDFIQKHPVATKRALRAILKATDLCAAQPERVAQQLVDGGWTPRYEYALQTLTEVPYNRWREFDPEDALRFYALRLHEVGMIQSSPNAIITEGTDWRFLNELKRELKA